MPAPSAPIEAAFFDLDNTVVRGSAVFSFGRGAVRAKVIRYRDLWQFLWQQVRFSYRGENTGKLSDIQDRALALAAGHRLAEMQALMPDIYDRYLAARIWRQIPEIIAQHHAAGRDVWLVTASPMIVAEYVAERLGFTGALASGLEVTEDGVLTGRFDGPVLHGAEKAVQVRRLAAERGYDLADCWAYSDSINDLPMLELVGHPVAVNPDAQLRRLADARRWHIRAFRRERRQSD
ncbi:HAD family hydrolase [Pseudoclavibacter soli]|uniref:HAD family hydrolase n=1 Tax=Pseudoclavibacter soli TaxID=452623 RepID=UPI000401783F|nr:HAD-IB family hydrolase [Pseudoclavibacter soli]